MNTSRTPGTKAAEYDGAILNYIGAHTDDMGGPVFLVGVKNMEWENYRIIEVRGAVAKEKMLDFLAALGLSDLVEPGDTLRPETDVFHSKLDHLMAPE